MGLKRTLLEVLQDSEEPLTMWDLMERAAINRRTNHSVSSSLRKSMDEGLVSTRMIRTKSKFGPGKVALYKLTPYGKLFVTEGATA